MKQTVLTLAVLATLGLGACSSTKPIETSGPIAPGSQQAISEQRLSSEFKRDGIRVVYSITGEFQAIEAVGYAPVWGSSSSASREAYRVAELEAKKSINDFINKETISSTTSVAMISKNLEKAQDNKTNNFATNRNRDSVASITTDDEVSKEPGEVNRQENTAIRNDALQIASQVQTTIKTNNQGILSGLYLVEGNVINDGKSVRVVYRWDKKHEAPRKEVRGLMTQ